MSKMHVKTGDTVMIISGKDKGKTGKVLEVSPKEGKVIVEGLNIVTKHVKPRRMGETGGIVKYVYLFVCLQGDACLPQVQETHPVGYVMKGDKKVRVCKHAGCGETF